MLFRVLPAVCLAAFFSVGAVQAQGLQAPRELPPSGYQGQQYVDSRGCVFLRAGIGGRVNWVARISANRQPLCGYPPTFGAQRVAVVPDAAPAQPAVTPAAEARPAPQVAAAKPQPAYSSKPGDPIRTTASRYERPAVSVPVAVPVAAPQASPTADVATRTRGCPARSPYGKRAQLTDGRSSLICSANPDFDVTAAVRRYEARQTSTPYSVAAAAPRATTPRRSSGSVLTAEDNAKGYYAPDQVARSTVQPTVQPVAGYVRGRDSGYEGMTATARRAPAVASGYRRVTRNDHQDYGYRPVEPAGRYNNKRGQGTSDGWAQQDSVWTRDVPSVLVTETPSSQRGVFVTSTSNAARAAPSARQVATTARRGGYYVQVGTFGEAANASGASARLARAGLPVAASRAHRNGRSLKVILAGPFATSSQARDALGRVRNAGFGDAFIR